jgi:excisionase family DNA binding protein
MTDQSYHRQNRLHSPPRLLTPQDVAIFLHLTEETVVKMMRRGDLPGFKVGKQWRIHPTHVPGWEVGA